MTNKPMLSVERNPLGLSSEAYSVMLGMLEHCLNIRACMGMDEGFKDFDTEEEHDFVKELRALLDKEVDGNSHAPKHQGKPVAHESECTSCDGSGEYTDAIGDWRGYCTCPAGVEAEGIKGLMP